MVPCDGCEAEEQKETSVNIEDNQTCVQWRGEGEGARPSGAS